MNILFKKEIILLMNFLSLFFHNLFYVFMFVPGMCSPILFDLSMPHACAFSFEI